MKHLFFLFGLLLLASCKSIEAVAPTTNSLPVPALQSESSVISIPVQIDLKKYLKQVENSLPTSFTGKEEQCEGVSFAYRFEREPIQFSSKPHELFYDVDGRFELKLNYCPKCHELWDNGSCTVPRVYASCGSGTEAMRRVTVGYGTKIEITSNYKFKTSTELKKFEILDPCKITVFKYDATSEVKKQVKKQLEKLEDEIDSKIQGIDIKSALNDAWKQMQQPIPLSSYGFMYLSPKKMSFSQPTFKDNVVYLDLNMTVSPFVSTEKQTIKTTSLPTMEEFKKKDGFDMTVDVRASYDSLSSIINKEMKGKVLELKGKKVILEDLLIKGTQDKKMLFQLRFSGSKKGTIYLTGIPKIDSVKQTLYMDEIDFDVETKSVLLKSAKWLFNDRILQEIKKNAVFDLNPSLKDAKKMINDQLNMKLTPDVSLSGTIDNFVVRSLYLIDNAVFVRTYFDGNLKLNMK